MTARRIRAIVEGCYCPEMSNFPPDSKLVAKVAPSPNYDARKNGVRADMIVLHYTGMVSGEAALRQLCDPASKVSCHYLIFEDGSAVQLVPEAERAWHAGISSWHGETDINLHSIGIEIVNPGHDVGYPDFPRPQIDAVIALSRDIVARWPISPLRVLGHSDVAPSRKNDPGEKFPWRELHDAGVGVWIEPHPIVPGATLSPGDAGGAVANLQRALADYGYGIVATGTYDPATKSVVTAFQRHFRPARVDGMADISTIETLHSLLANARRLRP
jgi:N-acetylmuramoyl-L-alanine amidase